MSTIIIMVEAVVLPKFMKLAKILGFDVISEISEIEKAFEGDHKIDGAIIELGYPLNPTEHIPEDLGLEYAELCIETHVPIISCSAVNYSSEEEAMMSKQSGIPVVGNYDYAFALQKLKELIEKKGRT